MTNQYVNDRELHVGSATIKVAMYDDKLATYETAMEIGMLDGVSFKVTGDTNAVETDNADDIDFGMTNQQAEIAASAWKNFDIDMFYNLTGGMGKVTTVAASTATTVTDEGMKFTAKAPTQNLKHKSAEETGCTSIVVKSLDGTTTYVVDTDYTVAVSYSGYTTITRVATGTIPEDSGVLVSYSYKAIISKKFTYGSTKMPLYLHVWLVNTNADGKKFIIEIYRVSSIKSAELTLGSDKSKALMQMPISIIGKPDSSRAVDDDLFSIYDEQSYEGAVA